MIRIIYYTFFILLFCTMSVYAYEKLNLSAINSYDSIEFYNGKDTEIVAFTSIKPPYYCILILSSTGVPLSKGKIFFGGSIELLKVALSNAYLNPSEKWWSIELYQNNDFNHPYTNLPIILDANCDNGGLTFEIIEYQQPFYFISIKLKDGTIYRYGFIKSEYLFTKKDFDFILLDEIYMKNNDKFELLSCDKTNFDCSLNKYSYPYQYFLNKK